MPKRIDCSPENFTLEIFRGAACSESFEYANPDGTPIVMDDFTVIFILKDVFRDTLRLTSNDSPTALGSFVEITDPTNGLFRVMISDEETDEAELGNGRWAIELDEGDGYPYLLWRDNVIVSDI